MCRIQVGSYISISGSRSSVLTKYTLVIKLRCRTQIKSVMLAAGLVVIIHSLANNLNCFNRVKYKFQN